VRAESLASRIPYDAAVAARPHIAREGLRATLAGRPVGEWASELFAIAKDGLAARARRDPEGNDETVHLRHLGELLAAGQTPADALLARLDPDAPLPAQILTLARI
jgi:glutamate--cysteine ligase